MWWYFLVIAVVAIFALWFYFNTKVKTNSNYVFGVAIFTLLSVYILDSNLQYIVQVLNKSFSFSLPEPSQFGIVGFSIFSFVLLGILFLLTKNQEKKDLSTQNINMPNNQGYVKIVQHQNIYNYQEEKEEYFENDIDEKDAKRSIENINHLKFIENLGNEKRIALENSHKKWDTGMPYKMREGNSEFIEFLENVWLQLSEFYTSRNFDGKSPKKYIEDYIQERSEYHHSKHIIDGEFLGGSDTRIMIGADIIEDLEILIKDMIFTFSIYNDNFAYESWEDAWNIKYDDNGSII